MEEKLIEIICEIKDDESIASSINSSSRIIEDLGIDSLQMVNFILRVEEEFDVQIDFESFDFSNLSTIASFCGYISSIKE